MKRSKRLIRNVIIIVILLCATYYFGGYYISKEQCVIETIRALYGSQGNHIMEFDTGEIDYTIVVNEEVGEISLVGTKERGFLYQTASSYVGAKIDKSECIDTFGMAGSEIGMLIIVSRVDDTVVRVEAELSDGNIIVFDDWKGNYAGTHIPGEEWYSGTYRAYDSSGNIIGELQY